MLESKGNTTIKPLLLYIYERLDEFLKKGYCEYTEQEQFDLSALKGATYLLEEFAIKTNYRELYEIADDLGYGALHLNLAEGKAASGLKEAKEKIDNLKRIEG